MEENKTLEQLERELVELKKQNAQFELAEELEKQKKMREELAVKEKNKLKDELREELKKEYNLTATSRLPSDNIGQQSMNLTSDKGFEEFKAGYISRANKKGLGVKGLSYAELLEGMQYGVMK